MALDWALSRRTDNLTNKTHPLGTNSMLFGILGTTVPVLNQIGSLIGPFSFGTESGGNGFVFEPCPHAFGYGSHSQNVA